MQYNLVKQFTSVKPTEENIWDFKFDPDSITFKEGDIIETAQFIKGQPLFIGSVLRNGQQLQSYVAGKSKGLTKLTVN